MRPLIALFAAACIAAPALAQTWPDKSIRIVVPFSPGGIADNSARAIAEKLGGRLGQPVVIENKPGAGMALAFEYVAKKSAPDGYTIVFGNASTHAINGALFKNLQFDPIKDFEPVTNVASVNNVLLVSPDFPGKTLADLISLAKAQPGKLTFASNSVGSSNHLSGELLKSMAKIDMLHIPYKSATGAQTDLMGGRITMMFDNMTTAVPQVKAGKLRALAVTGMRRSPLLPDVPTIDESGLRGYDRFVWNRVTGPAGLPASVTARLNAALARSLEGAEIRDALARQGLEAQTNTPEQFAALIKADIARNAVLVKAAGMQPE